MSFLKDAPNPEKDLFNPTVKGSALSGHGRECGFFKYKGTNYFVGSVAPGWLHIVKPESIGYQLENSLWNVEEKTICQFHKIK